MGKTQVTDVLVYSALAPTDEERKSGIAYVSKGDLSEPELIDKDIEDSKKRQRLLPNAGNISITVVPGAELGQVSVNVQFEGKSGLYNRCLHNQGELLEAASDWIGELLAELGGDFDVRIEAKPCPKGDQRLPLKHAVENLTRCSDRVERQNAGDIRVDHVVCHTLKNEKDI